MGARPPEVGAKPNRWAQNQTGGCKTSQPTIELSCSMRLVERHLLGSAQVRKENLEPALLRASLEHRCPNLSARSLFPEKSPGKIGLEPADSASTGQQP